MTQPIDELLVAVRSGDIEATDRVLTADGTLLDKKGGWEGRTALHCAALAGHGNIVQLLLDRGADVMARDDGDRATPLAWAAHGNHVEVVRTLVEHGADVTVEDDLHEWGVLGWATIEDTHERVAELLIDEGAPVNVFHAIALNDEDRLRHIVAHDPGTLGHRLSTYEHFEYPLHFAIFKHRPEMVSVLLSLGADVNQANWCGLTPLAVAHFERDTAAARLLQARMPEEHVSVSLALGEHDRAEQLLHTDALKIGGSSHRMLHYAAEHGHADVARTLVERGAFVNAKIEWWDNKVVPLHPAASYGHLEIVQLLVDGGARLHVTDDVYGGTPLAWAMHYDRSDVISYLKDAATAE